jgi:acyl dehydratase
MIYLEDTEIGQVYPLGTVTLSKQEIIAFATAFDPQSIHLDEEAAKPIFGGLIASGWHTASLCSRLSVDGFLGKTVCHGSPGVDNIRFLQPVSAGDSLTGRLTIKEKKLSKRKPDRGTLGMKVEMFRADGTLVFDMQGVVIIGCNPA